MFLNLYNSVYVLCTMYIHISVNGYALFFLRRGVCGGKCYSLFFLRRGVCGGKCYSLFFLRRGVCVSVWREMLRILHREEQCTMYIRRDTTLPPTYLPSLPCTERQRERSYFQSQYTVGGRNSSL